MVCTERWIGLAAYSVGRIPDSYRSSLKREGMKGARLGIVRESMDPKTDPSSEDYKNFRVVTDQAIRRLELLGAELVHPFSIPELKDRGGCKLLG